MTPTKEMMSLLGTISDGDFGKRFFISKTAAHEMRKRWGIAPLTEKPPEWSADDLAMLGKLPDKEIARITGRSANTVKNKRKSLGIDPGPPLPKAVCPHCGQTIKSKKP